MATVMKEWKVMLLGIIKWTQLPIDPAKAIHSFLAGTWKAQGCETARLASMILPLTQSISCRVAAMKPDFPLFLNLRGRRYYKDLKTGITTAIQIPFTLAFQPVPNFADYPALGNEIWFLRGFPQDDSGAATEAVLQLCNLYFAQILPLNRFNIILRPTMSTIRQGTQTITIREYIGVFITHPTVDCAATREAIGIEEAASVHTVNLAGFKLLFGRDLTILMKTSPRDLAVSHVCTRINNIRPPILPWVFLESLVDESSNAISFVHLDFYYVETDYHICHPFLNARQLAEGANVPVQGNAITLMSKTGQIAIQFLQQHHVSFATGLDLDGRLKLVCFELPNWENTRRAYSWIGGPPPQTGGTKGKGKSTKGQKTDHLGFVTPNPKKEPPVKKAVLKLKADWLHPDSAKAQAIKEEIQEEQRTLDTISHQALSKPDNILMYGFFILAKQERRQVAGQRDAQADQKVEEWMGRNPHFWEIISKCSADEKLIFQTVAAEMEQAEQTKQTQEDEYLLQQGFNLHRRMEIEGERLLASTEDAVQLWTSQYPALYTRFQYNDKGHTHRYNDKGNGSGSQSASPGSYCT